MTPADFGELVEIGRTTRKVNNHNSARPFAYRCGDPFWIEIDSLRINVYEDRHCTNTCDRGG
jgi:hypothetical protein